MKSEVHLFYHCELEPDDYSAYDSVGSDILHIRNILREGGFYWDSITLDDIWAGLIKKAVNRNFGD